MAASSAVSPSSIPPPGKETSPGWEMDSLEFHIELATDHLTILEARKLHRTVFLPMVGADSLSIMPAIDQSRQLLTN